MNSIKCKNCGLSNFGSETDCRRCGSGLSGKQTHRNKDGKRPPILSLASLLVYAAIALGGYLLYTSLQRSMADVDSNEAFRVGTQVPQKSPQPGLSRTEADRQHANGVGAAIKENPNITAQKQHNEETQKIMDAASR
jgi:hypothetical protein